MTGKTKESVPDEAGLRTPHLFRLAVSGAGRRLLCLLLLLTTPLLAATAVPAAPPSGATMDRLVANGGLLLTRDHEIICQRNPDLPLVPASIWKIGTALAALHILGSDHRFETRFYLDGRHTLYIEGFGDPFLISEEAATIMEALKTKGVERINDIVLDDSRFDLNTTADGAGLSLNPYDAANTALGVNFNTVHLRVGPDGMGHSAEPQTPDLPLMAELAKGLAQGDHRINIGADRRRLLRHTGELFRAMQRREGIKGSGLVRPGRVPTGLTAVHVHRSSKALPELIQSMLRYSNNFIANQLFLACGARQSGYPSTWDKGRTALAHFLRTEVGLSSHQARVEEGSGLSRHNRVTPRAMGAILDRFKPYHHLLPNEKGRLVKSGTLTGVYAYAGYLPGRDGVDSFVLILNQPANTRDRLLELLAAIHGRQAAHPLESRVITSR